MSDNERKTEATEVDEREALIAVIASVAEHDPDTHDFYSPRKLADAILAAGFTRATRPIPAQECETREELLAALKGWGFGFDHWDAEAVAVSEGQRESIVDHILNARKTRPRATPVPREEGGDLA